MTKRLPTLALGVLALVVGLLLSVHLPAGSGAALLLVSGLALLFGRAPPALGFGALGLCLGAGAFLGQVAAASAATDCRAAIPDGAALEVHGVLEALPTDGGAPVRLERVRLGERAGRCRGTVRVRLSARAQAVEPGGGARIVGWGRWWANPAEDSGFRRPERAGTLVLDSIRVVDGAGRADAPLLRARAHAQERLRRLFPERHGVAEALILAQRDGLDPEVRERFARAGLMHLLAISGMHVGLIAGLFLLLGRLLRAAHRPTAIAAAGVTLAYVLFLGAPHAATRAALQILLVLAARLAQRPSNAFALLAAAALPILAYDPLAALEPGFQLSFAGTAGIIALRRRFLALCTGRMPRALADALATGLAATLATTPIAALHFNRIAPIGIVANLAAMPVVAAAVPATAAALAASAVWWPAGHFLAGGADLLLAALDAVARAAAAVPAGHGYVPRDTVLAWALAAGLAAVAAARTAGMRPAVRRVVIAGAALALVVAWPPLVARTGGGTLEIHAIDVGQGDAFAVRSPGGRWILVDVGPRTERYDAGRTRVVPFLMRNGVRRIDAMILTHPHADHIGGAVAVLEAVDVRAVLDPAVPAPSRLYLMVLRSALERGGRWYAARAGRELEVDGMVLDVLHPSPGALDATRDANEVSVVFRLRYGEFAALFLGDAYAPAEEWLAGLHGAGLRAELLKVGHHGSATSTSDSLLRVVEPRLALISLGRRNRYGHPAPAVLNRLAEHGVHVWRTDEHGTIRVRVDAAGRVEVTGSR